MDIENWESSHVSRSWGFPELGHLRDCGCRRTPCGGTFLGDWTEDGCKQHNLNKTIRNSHSPERCPSNE